MLAAEVAVDVWKRCFGEVYLVTWGAVQETGLVGAVAGVVAALAEVVAVVGVLVALEVVLEVAAVSAEAELAAVGKRDSRGPIRPIGPISETFLILFMDL